MATDKLYTVAGTSTLNGETKTRFANDTMRIKVLAKNGHTDIQLAELPEAMTKVEAAKFLATLPEFAGDEAQGAIAEYLAKHDKQPKSQVKKAVASVKVPKTKTAKVSSPKVDLDDMEDAPF
jgi:hypothetical protein